MVYLYDTILYRPLLNALIFFYNTIAVHDLGLAIIFLTILIRLILFPVFHKSARHQVITQRLQPHIKRIQELHKGDREKQTKALMELHKEHGVSPFSGFLLLLVQLPILIALYQIVLQSLKPGALSGLYSFISAPEMIQPTFLHLINLGERSILIVSLAALAQYLQAKLSLTRSPVGEKPTQAEKVSRKMVYVAPIITLTLFWNFPAAIGLYWCVTSLFSAGQQIIINKQLAQWNPSIKSQKK